MLTIKRAASMTAITAFALGGLALATPAQAADTMVKVKVCNKTSATVYAKVGGWDYYDNWQKSSLLTIKKNECKTPDLKYKRGTTVTIDYGSSSSNLNKELTYNLSEGYDTSTYTVNISS